MLTLSITPPPSILPLFSTSITQISGFSIYQIVQRNLIIVLCYFNPILANSHLELNLTGTSNINGKEKVGLICRLDSFVRKNKYIQKKI